MTIIYAVKSDEKQAKKLAEEPYLIESPYGFSQVNHTATKALIIGSHPKVEKAYRGIMPVEIVESEGEE